MLVAALTWNNQELFNNFNEWLNILQSVQLPFAMLPLLHLTSKTRIMGRFRSSTGMMYFNFFLALIVFVGNFVLIFQFIQQNYSIGLVIGACVYGIVYLCICARLLFPLH